MFAETYPSWGKGQFTERNISVQIWTSHSIPSKRYFGNWPPTLPTPRRGERLENMPLLCRSENFIQFIPKCFGKLTPSIPPQPMRGGGLANMIFLYTFEHFIPFLAKRFWKFNPTPPHFHEGSETGKHDLFCADLNISIWEK